MKSELLQVRAWFCLTTSLYGKCSSSYQTFGASRRKKNSKYNNNKFTEHLLCIKHTDSILTTTLWDRYQFTGEKIKAEKVLQVSSGYPDCKVFRPNQGLFSLTPEFALLTTSAYFLLWCHFVCSFSLACLWLSHSNHFPIDRILNWLWSQLL